ncbi:hypothetical protein Gotri_026740, partial [Gossypium trilobum]|nr:hypothetical protein [Gossypium trilobum]
LILRNCKRLKSLPELPPSLEHLDAHDCTSLEDISSIKKLFKQALFCQDRPYRSLVLDFSNCFKLGEKGVGNDIDADDNTSLEEVSGIKKKAASGPETPKLEMPFEHIVTLLKDYHQATPESKKRNIATCVPGSEIPEWFDFKSLGSSMNIQLPSEWCSNNSWINFSSFVASAVVSFPDSSYTGGEFDHVFLVYDGFKVRDIVKSKASNNRIYIEAAFNFYLEGLDSSECEDLVSLKVITINYSMNLERIPDLSSAPNLEKINLRWCSNLRELPSSPQHLKKLTLLNVDYCKNLRSLPSFYKATSPTNLDLGGCSNLCSFPEIMGTMESLRHLVLSGTALKELPSSIGNLIGLEHLNMNNCKNLVCLPDSFCKLKSLERFYLKGCSRLEIFPEIMDTMEWLYELDLSGTTLKELPSSIGNLIGLQNLALQNCENLVAQDWRFFRKSDTMESLRYLDLSGTALKELPSSIENLIGLEHLHMNNCKNLFCLPDSFYKLKSLDRFYLKGRSRLEIFPEIMNTMERLYELDLSGTTLKELPSPIDNLIGLKYLSLNDSENLICLPDNFYTLKSLEGFYLKGCSRLEIFPEIMDTMERLYELDLSGTALKELPSSIGNLIGLQNLALQNYENLVCLPN